MQCNVCLSVCMYMVGMSCPSQPRTASLGCDALNENSLSMGGIGILPKHELLANDFLDCLHIFPLLREEIRILAATLIVLKTGPGMTGMSSCLNPNSPPPFHHFAGLRPTLEARPQLFRTPSTLASASLEPQGFGPGGKVGFLILFIPSIPENR